MSKKIVVHLRKEETKAFFNIVKSSLFSQRFPEQGYGNIPNTEVLREVLKVYANNAKLIEYTCAYKKVDATKAVNIGLKYYLKKEGNKDV